MESPEYLRISLAAAMTLGYKKGLFYRDAKSPCLNVLLSYDNGCRGNCSYCGLSIKRPGIYNDKSFIRVGWDSYKLDEIKKSISENKEKISRICISMITNIKCIEDTVNLTKTFKDNFDIPISLLISPTILNKNDLVDFKNAGADRLGISIDCASKTLFDKFRGKDVSGPHKWETYWKCFEDAVEIFGPDRVGIHLIVGLGETDKEMIDLIQEIRNKGGFTHLFSFFPETDSKLYSLTPPDICKYRRIQLSRYLIDEDVTKPDQYIYNNEGNLISINIPKNKLLEYVESGEPFIKSGCPDKDGKIACNRPYSNSRPSEEIRNFPFPPDINDIIKIKEEIKELIQ
jgi:lipoyl synthase